MGFFALLGMATIAGLFSGPAATAAPPSRRLLTLSQEDNELLSEDQVRSSGVILPIIGVAYIFIALALVCDEYFVPALDVIVEKLGVSPDVAGDS